MALNAALKPTSLKPNCRTQRPQWEMPIAEVRQAFRNLWTPPSPASQFLCAASKTS
jgi:hypothetical protein